MRRRDAILAMAGALVWPRGAQGAADPAVATERVPIAGDAVRATRYLAAGPAPRPTVLLLPGSKGLAGHPAAYARYGQDLARAGLDTLVFDYARPDDLTAIERATDAAGRRKVYAAAIDRWVSLVRSEATSTSPGGHAGRIGVIGFSEGGFVAVAAARRPLFSAAVVFYAGLPHAPAFPVTSLPPLLAIHGGADRVVPPSDGAKLVDAARRLGTPAEFATYPGQGHGFDLDLANPEGGRARQRAIAFLAHWLA